MAESKTYLGSGQKIYALSLQAAHEAGRRVEHSAWVVTADSIQQAEGLGFARALQLWPRDAGWSGHDASPLEVAIQPAPAAEVEADAENDPPETVM